ncbi:MAG: reverse transcriptase domain-containing protein, partial [Syntrophales bacterium]
MVGVKVVQATLATALGQRDNIQVLDTSIHNSQTGVLARNPDLETNPGIHSGTDVHFPEMEVNDQTRGTTSLTPRNTHKGITARGGTEARKFLRESTSSSSENSTDTGTSTVGESMNITSELGEPTNSTFTKKRKATATPETSPNARKPAKRATTVRIESEDEEPVLDISDADFHNIFEEDEPLTTTKQRERVESTEQTTTEAHEIPENSGNSEMAHSWSELVGEVARVTPAPRVATITNGERYKRPTTFNCPVQTCKQKVPLFKLNGHLDKHLREGSKLPEEWLTNADRAICPICDRVVSTKSRATWHDEDNNHYRHAGCKGKRLPAARVTRVIRGESTNTRVNTIEAYIVRQIATDEPMLLDNEPNPVSEKNLRYLSEIFTIPIPTIHFVPKKAIRHVGRAFFYACEETTKGDQIENWLPLLAFAKTVLRATMKEETKKTQRFKVFQDRAARFMQEGGWKTLWKEAKEDREKSTTSTTQRRELEIGSKKWKERICKLARVSSLSATFKNLTSEGVAPSSEETLSALKALHPERMTEIPEQAPEFPNMGKITREVAEQVIRGFPKGSAPGPDGLKPQILKDILKYQQKDEEFNIRDALCFPMSELVRGRAPLALVPFLAGANLTALNKKGGGIRPIAVGCTLRRATSRAVAIIIRKEAAGILAPTQVGVAISGGAEAIVEAVRSLERAHEKDENFMIFQADFKNAFNSVSRAAFITAVEKDLPVIGPWIRWCYSTASNLFVRSDGPTPKIIQSIEGCQQGDPLGPLLFCLAIRKITEKIRNLDNAPLLNAWYFDDGTIAGNLESVRQAMEILETEGKEIGLTLNHAKSILYWPAGKEGVEGPYNLFPETFGRSETGVVSLGVPIGSRSFISEFLEKNSVKKIQVALDRLKLIDDPQVAFSLLRNCTGFCRVNYLSRALDCDMVHDTTNKYDEATRVALEEIIGTSIADQSFAQAQLPMRMGGLGLRSPADHLGAARLALVNSNQGLVQEILEATMQPACGHSEIQLPLEFFAQSLQCSISDVNSDLHTESRQKELSAVVDGKLQEVLLDKSKAPDKARILSCEGVCGSIILCTPGVEALGTRLTPHEFRTFLLHRLGVPTLFEEDKPCPLCATPMDSAGYHAATCHSGPSLNRRHNTVRNSIYQLCRGAAWNPSLEKELVAEGRRIIPGDVFIPKDIAHTQAIAIDVTITHPLQNPTVAAAANRGGYAAEVAENKKIEKNGSICAKSGVEFIPFAIEFFGKVGTKAEKFIDKMAT